MINKKDFMKKLKKNRFIVLIISVIVVTGVYYGVDKAIDSYNFKKDSDIANFAEVEKEQESVDTTEKKNWFERFFDGNDEAVDESKNGEGVEMEEEDNSTQESISGQIDETEVDLELEGIEEGTVNLVDGSELKQDGEKELLEEKLSEEKIYVYITGEINVPGVVILDKGSRIVDAINSAGGTTANADVSKVNIVYVLEDGMKVNIPNFNDLKNNPNFEYITMSSGDGAVDEEVVGEVDSRWNSSSSDSDYSNNYSVVNINTASQTELESLPGIGPSLALKIINYRKENGNFSTIEQIKNVSGIGDSKFENIRKFIKV